MPLPEPDQQLATLAALLAQMGCPPPQTPELARQLDRRARQLAQQKNRTYEDALLHLLNLMRQGWAAPKS